MNAAERLAALKLMQHGLAEQIKITEAEVINLRKLTGAKQFDPGPGTITVAHRAATFTLDEDELIKWAEVHMPHEVQTIKVVRDTLRKTLADRFEILGDEVVDTVTGETIEWAKIRPAGAEYVTTRLTPEAKASAAEAIGARVDQIVGVVTLEGPSA